MIVEDQLDRGRGRIGRIDKLEKLHELAAAMAVARQGMYLPADQIDPGEQADRAVALVFMVARKTRMPARFGWQVGGARCVRLNTRLPVIGDPRDLFIAPLRCLGRE